MKQKHFLVIGDAMIDHFLFLRDATVNCELQPNACLLCMRFGDKIPVDRYAATVAGNAANVAVGLARLGIASALFTVVGSDVGGREILHRLKREGVETRWVRCEQKVNTNVSGVISFHGERTILVHHVPRRYPPLPQGHFSWVYFTSLGPKLQEVERVQRMVAARIKKDGTSLAYNPGSFQLRLARKAFLKLLPICKVLFLNKEEAQLVSGVRQPPEKPQDLLFALARFTPGVIIITDGQKGSYAYDHHRMFSCPIFPGRALERTGAGDSFGTGVVAALSAGNDLAEALRWGSANAASVVQAVGPQAGLLHNNEMQRMLRKYRRIQPKQL